jgi:hypothetical protein
MGFGQLLAQLFGQDAGSRGLYAQIQSQRQSPIYPSTFNPGAPGATPPGTQPMYGGQPIKMGGMVQWA